MIAPRRALAFIAGFCCVALWPLAAGTGPHALANSAYSGTWRIAVIAPTRIDLELDFHSAGSSWDVGETLPFDERTYPGLTVAQMKASMADVHFRIVRDAGTFECRGYFTDGKGSGVFDYSPSESYAAALASHGIGQPDERDQFKLTLENVTLADVDSLRSDGVGGLSVSALVRLGEHGAGGKYVSALIAAGVKPRSVDEIVRLRDHDVEADYVTGLARYGYHPGVEDLVRLRDHDVTLDFVARLKSHGYAPSVDDLIRLRDAGV